MKRNLTAFLLLVAIITSFPKITSAQVSATGLPFGGRIVFEMPCINGLLIVVVGSRPQQSGPFIITPAVIPRAYYAPFFGNAIKGTFIPGIPCYIPPFIIIPTLGAVTQFGTSLVPSI